MKFLRGIVGETILDRLGNEQIRDMNKEERITLLTNTEFNWYDRIRNMPANRLTKRALGTKNVGRRKRTRKT